MITYESYICSFIRRNILTKSGFEALVSIQPLQLSNIRIMHVPVERRLPRVECLGMRGDRRVSQEKLKREVGEAGVLEWDCRSSRGPTGARDRGGQQYR